MHVHGQLADQYIVRRWKHNIAPHSYRESGRRSCLVLVNSHFALAPPRPLGPKVHVVGPLTAKAPEPLPADLEAFMQSAGQFGVVYASLGYTAIPGGDQLCWYPGNLANCN